MTDIEIADLHKCEPIEKIAKKIGLKQSDLMFYGKKMAKIDAGLGKKHGKLILVTAINPTPAGEGKTTVSIGLADAMNLIKKQTCLALREPSLGPVFGIKGGATGGGYSQIVPMEEINLHFTGDFHAITSANNLLCALIDNHIYQGNELDFDIDKICFKRCLDLNDRALRGVQVGLGGKTNGIPRFDGFEITAASEVMAIMCLSTDLEDLKTRLGNILVGYSSKNKPIFACDLKAENAMAILLQNALKPNLVQTLGGTPALVHMGPFANIAHGCNSVIATKMALSRSEYVVTEAGFGADLGAEKFLDVKCRQMGIKPNAVVIVATVRALKYNGGILVANLKEPNVDAVQKGVCNLIKHLNNIQNIFKLPVVIAINKFTTDTDEEIAVIENEVEKNGAKAIVCNVWANGGKGALNLAQYVCELCKKNNDSFEFAYKLNDTIAKKINDISKKIYGAKSVCLTEKAKQDIKQISKLGKSDLPVVIAKTQMSLSDNKNMLGCPKDFEITIDEVKIKTGANFIVAIAGNMLLMPGLSKTPSAVNMTIDNNGKIKGLF